ncbi:hydroxypyruvate isomerase family protein [Glycomyces buryatensis]|uniref:Hydroxypyruvate isomerase n=1 Tax=Glycomyces buryatensis TaxID=2570927 RepID=A0A4S8PTF1_9ACTN|nr:TIM barrel protein [Glycomyces buryatensis]THV34677.1 hydroxypyruvate isomerase [Glycomyces buryatensis]
MSGLRFDANLKWLFTEHDFLDRFAAAAAAGFDAVEFPDPYAHSRAELRKRLEDNGLHLVLINTPMGERGTPEQQGITCFPDLAPRFRSEFLKSLEYAVELGGDFVHLVGGMVPPGVSRDQAFARYVANVVWASEQAAPTGVRLLLEEQNKRDAPGFILQNQAQAHAVAAACDAGNVGVLLDVYHAQIDEGDILRLLSQGLPGAFHVQIADPPSRHEPGTGELNFRQVFAAIEASGYDGWIGCEYAPAAGTREGLSWRRELLG